MKNVTDLKPVVKVLGLDLMDTGKSVGNCIDLSRAFPTQYHTILIKKIRHYSITDSY